jgi:hypothetical protein
MSWSCVCLLEHAHKRAAVEDGDLGVGVLKVQADKSQAGVLFGKQGWFDRGLRMQAEKRVAHGGAIAGKVT